MKIFKQIGLIVFLLSFGFATSGCAQEETEKYDVVIYGGTFAGCAAARTAAQLAPESSILVIVPAPERVLGGIGTAGGQNFFDVRLWRGYPVAAGSFARWYGEAGQFYNTKKMADLLAVDLARHKNITVLWGYDVREVQKKPAEGGFASRIKRLQDLSGIERPSNLSGSKGRAFPPQTGLLPQTGPDLRKSSFSSRITALRLREVCRDDEGAVAWGKGLRKIAGRVFIDASDDGRLTRLAGASVTVGRGDWPKNEGTVPLDEKRPESVRHGEAVIGRKEASRRQADLRRQAAARRQPAACQQAATLMFKVAGVVVPETPRQTGDFLFLKDPSGSWGIIGGADTYRSNPVVVDFNDRYAPRGFALKPLNAAQDGAGSDQWWVNALLIFNVDGRACRRDLGTGRYPQDKRPDALDVDEALLKARELIARPEFLEALRQFSAADGRGGRYGFHRAELVKDESGRPVTGDVLYIRETIHLQKGPFQKSALQRNPGNPADAGTTGQQKRSISNVSGTGSVPGTVTGQTSAGPDEAGENACFALTPAECQLAGAGPADGADRGNYATRIGLAYYLIDINAYTPADLKAGGAYRWPVTESLRPDLAAGGGQPQNPVYLPFEMLVTPQLVNLLVPGCATGAASLAWAEVRVIPNLCVLGDAAGAAAAGAVLSGADPALFQPGQIKWVQAALRKTGARLDK